MWTPAGAVYLTRAVSIAALVIATTSAVEAAPPVVGPVSYAGAAALPDAELARLRGGMMVAGLDINFGAMVTVAVDGSQIAQTVFSLTDSGQVTGQTTIAATLPNGISAQVVSGNGVQSGSVSVQTLSPGTRGVVITNAAGQTTAALASVALDHTSSLLVNTASNQTVQQTVASQLAINNFTQVLQTLQPQILSAALAGTGRAAAAVGLR